MPAMNKPILMRFPLIGEWNTPNTPGSRIPSHGTNALGTRYAHDFLQLNWKKRGHPCYRSHVLSYLLFGVALSSCYCYGLPVYAPCDGRVVYVMDGCRERKRAWFFSDALMAFKNSCRRQNQEICEISGNAVIIQYTDTIYAAFCHLQPNSIALAVGQYVKAGDFIGSIGHSGNSMFPHLHFQLMDSADFLHANGLPCAFTQYEVLENGQWHTVYGGIPTAQQRIRYAPVDEYV